MGNDRDRQEPRRYGSPRWRTELAPAAFVCSPAEVIALRAALGPDVVLVTPGIRPQAAATGDQKRTGTPEQTIRDGAGILVVGRPIRDARRSGESRGVRPDRDSKRYRIKA